MKKLSGFCPLYAKHVFAPAAEKEQLIGSGWRSLSDMDGAVKDVNLYGFGSVCIRQGSRFRIDSERKGNERGKEN